MRAVSRILTMEVEKSARLCGGWRARRVAVFW